MAEGERFQFEVVGVGGFQEEGEAKGESGSWERGGGVFFAVEELEGGFILEGAQFEAGVFVVVVGGGGGGALAEVEADCTSFCGGFRKGGAENVEGEGLAWGEGLGERAKSAGLGEVLAVGEETPSTSV